jgi:hypothetical protein
MVLQCLWFKKTNNKTGAAMSETITDRSLKLFMDFANDAGNWGGEPLIGGNVGGSKEDNGNLTQLKRAGLIETFENRGTFIRFTDEGEALAAENGVDYFKSWKEYWVIHSRGMAGVDETEVEECLVDASSAEEAVEQATDWPGGKNPEATNRAGSYCDYWYARRSSL